MKINPPSFFNGFREIRKSTSGKTGVDMSTPVHPMVTPLNEGKLEQGGLWAGETQAGS